MVPSIGKQPAREPVIVSDCKEMFRQVARLRTDLKCLPADLNGKCLAGKMALHVFSASKTKDGCFCGFKGNKNQMAYHNYDFDSRNACPLLPKRCAVLLHAHELHVMTLEKAKDERKAKMRAERAQAAEGAASSSSNGAAAAAAVPKDPALASRAGTPAFEAERQF
jgi:hypothetical protein